MKALLIIIIIVFTTNILNAQIEKIWETEPVFKYPESAVYDKIRDVVYISNYTMGVANGSDYGNAHISKVTKDGELIEFEWLGNLTTPTGVTIAFDKLYVVERFGIVEFDLKNNRVSNKYLIKKTNFLNDISVGVDTSIYVSDSQSNIIYRIKNSRVEKWLESELIENTNGILVDGEQLIVGVNSDNYLKSINLKTKEIVNIAFLDEGEIDGIKKIGDDYLVSHYVGDLQLVTKQGKVTELLNTRDENIQCADFDYIPEMNLIIIPALINNKLFGYRLK